MRPICILEQNTPAVSGHHTLCLTVTRSRWCSVQQLDGYLPDMTAHPAPQICVRAQVAKPRAETCRRSTHHVVEDQKRTPPDTSHVSHASDGNSSQCTSTLLRPVPQRYPGTAVFLPSVHCKVVERVSQHRGPGCIARCLPASSGPGAPPDPRLTCPLPCHATIFPPELTAYDKGSARGGPYYPINHPTPLLTNNPRLIEIEERDS